MGLKSFVLLTGTFLILNGCGGSGTSPDASSGAAAPAATKNPVDPATAGKISGKINFSGTAPKMKPLSMSADAFCKTQHASKVESEDVIVNKNGTLKNVVIFIKSGLGDLKFPTPSEAATLNQVGCLYTPHVLAVQAGQKIIVKNSDEILHNVNARPSNNKGFNIGQPIKGLTAEKTFENPEIGIPVKCDVHPWMRGYINVFAHPYFAVTGEDGTFSLENLPPGKYTVTAWHEKYGTVDKEIEVGASEAKSLDFSFKGA